MPIQRFIRVLGKGSARGLVANRVAVQTGSINKAALDNQWVLFVPGSLSPTGHPPNYAAPIVNRWTRANLSIVSDNIVFGPGLAPGAGSPWNLNDFWDIQVAETGTQQGYGPDGKSADIETPLASHLKHRASGKYLVSVNGQLQLSKPGMPWRLIEVPMEELQKAEVGPLKSR
ncbi:MAG: hypothetical protein WD032_06610 [Nitrospirales bacterium]